ncbi:MAG: hypothetical protein E3J56_00620 [Candidatus Aminicenantes bacterium]|nr:MAG: hypothetical protein E3J56_00620 [Candidatus Aminicenantes bacterium]
MSFDDSIKELEKTYETGLYRADRIRKTLSENPRLRKTFAQLLILSCARFGEIHQKVFVSRKTCYSHLYQLMELGLAKQIAVMDLWNKKNLDKEQIIVLRKFKDWTSKMADKQVNYFAAQTHYFLLTELGKNPEIVDWVVKLEKEYKNS